MSVEIEGLVEKFEARRLSRRELVAALTGIVAAAAVPALAQDGAVAKVAQGRTNRTSGGDQLYFTDPDKTRVQLGLNGYQG